MRIISFRLPCSLLSTRPFASAVGEGWRTLASAFLGTAGPGAVSPHRGYCEAGSRSSAGICGGPLLTAWGSHLGLERSAHTATFGRY